MIRKALFKFLSPAKNVLDSYHLRVNLDDSGELYYYQVTAHLALHRPIVTTTTGKLVPEFLMPLQDEYIRFSGSREWWKLRFGRIIPNRKVVKGILLTFLYPENYFHWWVDSLARLSLVKAKLDLTTYQFICNVPLSNWQIESLKLVLGFNPNLLVRNTDSLEVGKLLVISPVRTKKAINPIGLNLLKQSTGALKRDDKVKRILITRSKAKGRAIQNIEELMPVLKKYNIELVKMEDFSVSEQIQLFSSVELVVAVHGAALTNLIFAPQTCQVIELFGATQNPLYENLSKALDLNYIRIQGKVVGDSKNTNLKINPDHLEAAVQ